MHNAIEEVVDKALTKSKRIVLSTIVNREDDNELKMKIEVVNSNMKYTFRNNNQVFICDNTNLSDEKFRWKDGVHPWRSLQQALKPCR